MDRGLVTRDVEFWVFEKLSTPMVEDKAQLRAELKSRLSTLDIDGVRELTTKALVAFLNENRTQRNRTVLEWIIESVDDINLCPYCGVETLLQRAMQWHGKPDIGIIKALIRAGHSFTIAPPGGVSPNMALSLMYGKPAYE